MVGGSHGETAISLLGAQTSGIKPQWGGETGRGSELDFFRRGAWKMGMLGLTGCGV